MSSPTVQEWMTPSPTCIGPRSTLEQAHALMRDQHVRHLPVVDEGQLVGVLSERDLYLKESLRQVDPKATRVEEVMIHSPYTVDPQVPLERVAITLWEHKYGSAIVVDRGQVVGIFTTTDALRAVIEMLAQQRKAKHR